MHLISVAKVRAGNGRSDPNRSRELRWGSDAVPVPAGDGIPVPRTLSVGESYSVFGSSTVVEVRFHYGHSVRIRGRGITVAGLSLGHTPDYCRVCSTKVNATSRSWSTSRWSTSRRRFCIWPRTTMWWERSKIKFSTQIEIFKDENSLTTDKKFSPSPSVPLRWAR